MSMDFKMEIGCETFGNYILFVYRFDKYFFKVVNKDTYETCYYSKEFNTEIALYANMGRKLPYFED